MSVRATHAEAAAVADRADALLLDAETRSERANWVFSTHITDDTAQIMADASEALLALNASFAREAAPFDGLELPDDVARRLALLKFRLDAVAPPDGALEAELSELGASLDAAFSTGRYAPPGQAPLPLDELAKIMAGSRDPDELLAAWVGWHAVGGPMRDRYRRFVEISNAGARSLGFADNGERWRAGYDLPAADLLVEVDRLWHDVRGLYASLHAYVRRRLGETYGTELVPPAGPLPVHLLGDMWGQDWSIIAPLVAPDVGTGEVVDVTALLRRQGFDAERMVRAGEGFFTSLGFEPLPDTFWTRSMFTRPPDRDVVCHPSAWTIGEDLDLRLKMCIDVTGQDFVTIHHELGHLFYMRAYRTLPFLFRDGANDGFHEAIGDAIALSVTPDYLVRIGLLDAVPGPEGDIALLLRQALETVARLGWELALERWRWAVFSGEIPEQAWNKGWWAMRREYQGVVPGVARSEADFDPGAKYHVAANTPYLRYFLSVFLQYQFHESMTAIAGLDGPLHRRSVYGSRAAGDRLAAMLAMGRSRPWPVALEALTGTRVLSAEPLLRYFAPLQAWLDAQNEGHPVGW